jgi:hypothetical protein
MPDISDKFEAKYADIPTRPTEVGQKIIEPRSAIFVPAYCRTALMRSAAVHIASALSSMSSRPQRSSKDSGDICHALCILMVSAAAQSHRHRSSRVCIGDEFPTEEYGEEKWRQIKRKREEEDSHLSKCAVTCLNALFFFLVDIRENSPLAQLNVSVTRNNGDKKIKLSFDDHPDIIRQLLSFNVLDTIKIVATLQNSEARLAAFEVLHLLSEWPLALEKMVSEPLEITKILVSIQQIFRL